MFQKYISHVNFSYNFSQSIFYKLIYRVYKVFKATKFNVFTMT